MGRDMFNRMGRSKGGGKGAFLAMAGLLASTLIAAPSGARADTTEELLDQLKAKGILTKGEYSKLKERHAHEKAALKGPAVAGAPSGGNGRYVTALDKGIGIRIPGQTIVTKDNGVVSVGDVDVKLTGALIFYGMESFKANYQGSANQLGKYGVPNGGANPYANYPGTTAFGPYARNYGVLGGVLNGQSSYNNSNSIRAGLLPSNVVLSLATNQMGWDLGFTVGAYFGGNNVDPGALNANSGGSPVGLGTPGIDLRQVFGTIGTPEIGTFKIGRDLGLFASDAILNDFALLGVGTPAGNAAPGNTTLGRIGLGYVYADWLPQITYTTPTWNGFTLSVAMMTPLDTLNSTGDSPGAYGYPANVVYSPYVGFSSATITGQDMPMFQGRLKYVGQLSPDVKLTAWTSGIYQQHRSEYGDAIVAGYSTVNGFLLTTPGEKFSSVGVDGGMRIDWGGFSVAGYGYWGSGLGTTGLFFAAFSPDGSARKSSGYYAEAQYTFGSSPYVPGFLSGDRFTIGGSYGQSFLSATAYDWTQPYSPYLLKSNSSAIGFIRYKVTDWASIQVEFINTKSINQSGGSITSNALAGGTTFFF